MLDYRRAITLAVLAGLLSYPLVGCASEQATATDSESAAVAYATSSGQIVETSASITNYRPENTTVAVEASTLDLGQYFADIGPDATTLYQHVQTLSGPIFEGRAPESRGIDLAAEYLTFYFRRAGLEPAFPSGESATNSDESAWVSYRQPFTFRQRGEQTPTKVLESMAAVNNDELVEGEDYVVLGNSGSGHITAPVTFVGYGINDGPDGYSSFDPDTDLTGRIAMMFRYEPLTDDGASRWSDRRFSQFASMSQKMYDLKQRGAAGIILVSPPDVRGGREGLENIRYSSRAFGPSPGVPTFQFSQEAADALLKAAMPEAGEIMDWRRRADHAEVRSVELTDSIQVTLSTKVERSEGRSDARTENVGGVLRGKGSLADEWIVIGAHYDHVGYGKFGTSPQYEGQLHPGADDNASGAAGLIELAEELKEKYDAAGDSADLRSILFIAFSAEESGLHGSRNFVNNPPFPLENIMAMLNMDMIGRMRNDSVLVMGVGTGEGFESLLQPHFIDSDLNITVSQGGSGRSDDQNFLQNDIPALHFFTGVHEDYHTPHDTAEKVNPLGAIRVIYMMRDIAYELATRSERMAYTTPPRSSGQDRGYASVRLGIRPGMADELPTGVMVGGVSEGTSAADAGLTEGDIILTWDGDELADLRALFEKLQQHKPGDVVRLGIDRNGKQMELNVTLKASEE